MKELPTRKDIRLKGYDYSSAGYYFITICVKDKNEILGKIVGDAHPDTQPVGDAHWASRPSAMDDNARIKPGDAHPGVPFVELTETGKMVQQYIENIHTVYKNIKIDKHVVMPNHIHMIVIIEPGVPGCVSPTKPMLAKVINALKSLTTRQYGKPLWQRSYHDHIIRDEPDYLRIWQYIDENPQKWNEDCYFTG